MQQVEISDDASQVSGVFEELKNNFYLNVTQSVEFREKALTRLVAGYKEMQPEIDEALKYDCGYNPFMANFVAHNITLTEINHLLRNIRKWTQPRPVKTPVSKHPSMQPWAWPPAKSSTNPWELRWCSRPGITRSTRHCPRWQPPSLRETASSSSRASGHPTPPKFSKNCSINT
jgi:hypothetical protein